MTLPVGARLGPYEALAAVGAGGMGEVYRARDTRPDCPAAAPRGEGQWRGGRDASLSRTCPARGALG